MCKVELLINVDVSTITLYYYYYYYYYYYSSLLLLYEMFIFRLYTNLFLSAFYFTVCRDGFNEKCVMNNHFGIGLVSYDNLCIFLQRGFQ